MKFRHKFRWIASDAPNDLDNTSTIISNQLCELLVQGTTLGASYTQIRSVRIVDVEMWGIFQGSTSTGVNPSLTNSISIEYPNSPNSGPGGPDARKSDTTMGTARPCHVRYRPPAKSLSSQWLNRSSQPVLVLNYPRGAVVDVTLDVVLLDSPDVTLVGTSGAVPGENYLLSLDHGGGGNFWVPVGYNTTT